MSEEHTAANMTQSQITDSELLSIAAHELKSPLAIIRTLSQCLESTELDTNTKKQLERITSTAERGLALVSAIMDMEQLRQGTEPIESEPVNLLHVTQDVVNELEPQLKQRQQHVRLYERTMLPIFTDQRYVRQIVHNLVDNAGKYSDLGKPIEIRFRSDTSYQSIRVRDYGIGVSKNEWSRLFGRFGKLSQPLAADATSNGLGLYISKQLSELLGGELMLQPKHTGSCFVLQLPTMQQTRLWHAQAW